MTYILQTINLMKMGHFVFDLSFEKDLSIMERKLLSQAGDLIN